MLVIPAKAGTSPTLVIRLLSDPAKVGTSPTLVIQLPCPKISLHKVLSGFYFTLINTTDNISNDLHTRALNVII